MTEDIRIPEIGEGVEAGTVVGILKQPGDRVEVEEGIIEVETQKAVVEIPSPVSGTITEILVTEGGEVKVGDLVARVETEDASAGEGAVQQAVADDPIASEVQERDVAAPVNGAATGENAAAAVQEGTESIKDGAGEGRAADVAEDEPGRDPSQAPEYPPVPASPSVRRLAREMGVDLRAVPGGGGRISAEDVKAFVKQGRSTVASEAGGGESVPAVGVPDLPDPGRWGEVTTEELSTVRRLTAEGTSRSWHTVPHVTQFDQADITDLEAFIDRHTDRVRAAGGKLTVTAILAMICARALKRFRRFNASIDTANNRLVYRHYVHIGIAVDTPRGLLVPVVRDADRKTITDLAVEIFDLAERARGKKVKPDELEGGTFTISNQGGIGGTGFTPIVLWPQAAILGISRAQSLPQVVGDRIEARRILPLALSYDHRILDGADAARFLRWICDSLAQPLTMHLN